MRIYKCCRMSCPCVGLDQRTAEVFYYQVLEEDGAKKKPMERDDEVSEPMADVDIEGLTAQGLIRWLLRVALHRYQTNVTVDTASSVDFHLSLSQFFERHLKLF